MYMLCIALLASRAVAFPAAGGLTSNAKGAQVVEDSISDVSDSVKSLDRAVNRFNGDPDTVQPLLDSSMRVQDMIRQANDDISGQDELGLTDALNVMQPAMDLTNNLNRAVNDLISKKPRFDKAGVSSVVSQQLDDQKQAGQDLSDAIVAKVPDTAKPIAQEQAKGITAALNRASRAFANSGDKKSSNGDDS